MRTGNPQTSHKQDKQDTTALPTQQTTHHGDMCTPRRYSLAANETVTACNALAPSASDGKLNMAKKPASKLSLETLKHEPELNTKWGTLCPPLELLAKDDKCKRPPIGNNEWRHGA